MHKRAATGLLSLSILALGGCDPKPEPKALLAPKVDPRALGASPLADWTGSDALRATFRNCGVEIPQLKLLIRRMGREFPGFSVTSGNAASTWERIRSCTEVTGFYPLILNDEYGNLTELPDDEHASDVQSVLTHAQSLDSDQWLASKRAFDSSDPESAPPRSPGATSPTQSQLAILTEHTGRPSRNLFIILLPTREGAECPALLLFGGWNACPEPSEHVMMLRRWYNSHHAEPMAMTGDTIELRVAKPVRDLKDALLLAEDMCTYCSDIVHQGVGSIDALASSLVSAKYWYFWWD